MSEIEPPLSWQEPFPAEGPKPWAAFCRYRDMGEGRSLARVGQELVKSRTLITRWSHTFEWVARTGAYDQNQRDKARQLAETEHVAKIKAYRERAAKLGAATADVSLGLLVAVGQRLKGLTSAQVGGSQENVASIPLTSLPSYLRAAADVAQKSLAMEAESLGVRELEKMIDDEDAAEDTN